MIFATIFLILLTVRYFVMGVAFYDTLVEIEQLKKDKADGKKVSDSDIMVKSGFPVITALIGVVFMIAYTIYAYDYDPLKWPTLVSVVLQFGPLFFVGKGKFEVHKWTPRGMIRSTAWLTYLLYIGAAIMGWL